VNKSKYVRVDVLSPLNFVCSYYSVAGEKVFEPLRSLMTGERNRVARAFKVLNKESVKIKSRKAKKRGEKFRKIRNVAKWQPKSHKWQP
jgi:hypothetical protein